MSLLTDLWSTFEKCDTGGLASTLGQPHQSVSQGMQTAIGTILGGIANKSGSPDFLRNILSMVPHGTGEVGESDICGAIANPNSPLVSAGKNILSSLFGGSEGKITQAVGAEAGLPPSTTSLLLSIAAPLVVSFLGRRAQAGGLSAAGLGSLLQRELPAIRAALPSSICNLLGATEVNAGTAPVETVQRAAHGSSLMRWMLPLLLVLLPAIWLFKHTQKPALPALPLPPTATGTANRSLPLNVSPRLPGKLDLHFQTASTALQPDAKSELREFAGVMAADRDARITVSGFTDNRGTEVANLRLSQRRADAVKSDLVRMGVPENRITAKGFGEQNPIGDNSTVEGRAANKRVTVEISDR